MLFWRVPHPQWLKSAEVTQAGGTSIKIEASNQFVPLFTNPQEVVETRNKVICFHCCRICDVYLRCLHSVMNQRVNLTLDQTAESSGHEDSRATVSSSGQCHHREQSSGKLMTHYVFMISSACPACFTAMICLLQSPVSPLSLPSEPEPPNPFSDLTDQALEEYKKEVQRKQDGGTDGTGRVHFVSWGSFYSCQTGQMGILKKSANQWCSISLWCVWAVSLQSACCPLKFTPWKYS